MTGKIFKSLLFFSLLWLVGCMSAPDAVPATEPAIIAESETPLPPTPTITETSPTLTAIPTLTPLPTGTPSSKNPIRVENAAGSWVVEYEEHYGNWREFSLYRVGDPEPFLVQNAWSYFDDHPEEKDVFDTNQSPVPAIWTVPAWSPDGRYLAFLGAIEGPSSDLYVFDTETEEINRLTTGENQASDIVWSPDSQWILHEEILLEAGYDSHISYWAARADGSEVRWLYHPYGAAVFLVWVDDARFYVYDKTAFGASALRLIDLDSGEVVVAYNTRAYDVDGGVMMDFAIDPESKAVLYFLNVMPDYPVSPYYDRGIYLFSPAYPRQRLVVPPIEEVGSYRLLNIWDENLGVFITRSYCDDDPGLYYAVTPDGETYCIEYDD